MSRLRCGHRASRCAAYVTCVDLISDALPFGRLWYGEVNDAIDYAKFRSRSCIALIRVYDAAGNVIETHEHAGDFERRVSQQRR